MLPQDIQGGFVVLREIAAVHEELPTLAVHAAQ